MRNLIEALQIFLKYGNPSHPTHCEHDEMTICGINPKKVSQEDKDLLYDLGFFEDEGDKRFKSFRYGSA